MAKIVLSYRYSDLGQHACPEEISLNLLAICTFGAFLFTFLFVHAKQGVQGFAIIEHRTGCTLIMVSRAWIGLGLRTLLPLGCP